MTQGTTKGVPIDVDGTLAANSDSLVASQKATKTYADTKVTIGGALGTPSSGVLTNCTGTASGLTAGTVTTNANLTGDVTSTGNATTIAAATVTGKALTGFSASAGTIAATDTILQGFNKIDGNLRAHLGGYVTIQTASTSHTAAKTAGKYLFGYQQAAVADGVGSLNPPAMVNVVGADYPAISGLTAKFRLRVQVNCNDNAPTGTYTFGLYPVTRPTTSGGSGVCIYTMGTVVSGSDGAAVSTPAADSVNLLTSSTFTIPADGQYVIGMVTTGTVAANAHMHITAQLQLHYE
jgi:hypothetical protein